MLKQRRGRTATRNYISGLKKTCKRKLDERCEILICIDASEQISDNKSRIKEFMTDLKVMDIAAERHINPPPTYVRNNAARRIDFLLCAEEVNNNIEAYGMAPLDNDNILGDHRLQYADIQINRLFGIKNNDVISPTSRRLRSTNLKCIKNY